jgi:large subunit ribosomal protein L15
MNLHNLKPNKGAKHRVKRLGKGESSGLGKTSGKGHKGQKARSGSGVRVGFEGGQMPLHRRLPKKGFNNKRFADKVIIVTLYQLEKKFESGATVNEASLRELGLIKGEFDQIKILGNGELTKELTVDVDALSASAKEKIEKAGGSIA